MSLICNYNSSSLTNIQMASITTIKIVITYLFFIKSNKCKFPFLIWFIALHPISKKSCYPISASI